jgi:hypothetical protein
MDKDLFFPVDLKVQSKVVENKVTEFVLLVGVQDFWKSFHVLKFV